MTHTSTWNKFIKFPLLSAPGWRAAAIYTNALCGTVYSPSIRALIKPYSALQSHFAALLRQKESTDVQNILASGSFFFPSLCHMRSAGELQRWPCRRRCFMCHPVITLPIVTAHDTGCLPWLPPGGLELPAGVPHSVRACQSVCPSLGKPDTLSSIYIQSFYASCDQISPC